LGAHGLSGLLKRKEKKRKEKLMEFFKKLAFLNQFQSFSGLLLPALR
jgi:hypothetical protein